MSGSVARRSCLCDAKVWLQTRLIPAYRPRAACLHGFSSKCNRGFQIFCSKQLSAREPAARNCTSTFYSVLGEPAARNCTSTFCSRNLPSKLISRAIGRQDALWQSLSPALSFAPQNSTLTSCILSLDGAEQRDPVATAST